MSVLIKMDMPKSPQSCKFYDTDPLGIRKPYCAIKSVCNGFDDCPLVEVPPHGRLIDADDMASITIDCYAIGNWKRINAPTIIESEGKK